MLVVVVVVVLRQGLAQLDGVVERVRRLQGGDDSLGPAGHLHAV